LKVTTTAGHRSFFVDGGFVQVLGSTVSLLTNRAVPVENLSAVDAEKQLQAADARVARTDEEVKAKWNDQQRARRMLALATGPKS
jgi:F-type H+-transporting ATPase subunit epsilon